MKKTVAVTLLAGLICCGCASVSNKASMPAGFGDRIHVASAGGADAGDPAARQNILPPVARRQAGNAANDTENKTLSSFSTEFKNATKSRSHNIRRASASIDQTVITPGETFSYNNTIGPTSKANGYMLGRVFVKGKDSKGYGGGVCQVSSTLYNAALEAELEITERHPHSKAVGYVEEGKDAATSYGSVDLKFVNNKSFPIKINSYVETDKITVAIERA